LSYTAITILYVNVRLKEEVDLFIGLTVGVRVCVWSMVLSNGKKVHVRGGGGGGGGLGDKR
jgi:hypothetical protein